MATKFSKAGLEPAQQTPVNTGDFRGGLQIVSFFLLGAPSRIEIFSYSRRIRPMLAIRLPEVAAPRVMLATMGRFCFCAGSSNHPQPNEPNSHTHASRRADGCHNHNLNGCRPAVGGRRLVKKL